MSGDQGGAGDCSAAEAAAFAPRSFQSAERSGHRAAGIRAGRCCCGPIPGTTTFILQALAAGQRGAGRRGFRCRRCRSGHICCGRPLYDFGFLAAGAGISRDVMTDGLRRQIDAGLPVVFLEPTVPASSAMSWGISFRTIRAPAAAGSELSAGRFPGAACGGVPAREPGRAFRVLHGHCHQKSQMKMKEEVALLERAGAGCRCSIPGCCGMAGPFGFEKEKFAVSQAWAERVLLPAVRDAAPDTILVADGFSCREQIAQNSSRKVLHFAQVLRHGGE